MSTTYESRYASSPSAVKQYDTKQLREEFLVDNLMEEGKITLTYSHYDRYIAGSAVPVDVLKLETIDPLKSDYFLERREIGIINVGGDGTIEVDGEVYELGFKDAWIGSCFVKFDYFCIVMPFLMWADKLSNVTFGFSAGVVFALPKSSPSYWPSGPLLSTVVGALPWSPESVYASETQL